MMAAVETCSRCGQEVRRGWRHGRESYWHREDVDHEPIFGAIMTADRIEDVRREREDVVRYTDDGDPYTSAEWEISRDKDTDRRRRRLALYRGEDPDHVEPLPAPEVPCHPIDIEDLPARSGMRQVANLVLKQGWELRRLTAARGPYIGSKSEVLSTSDTVVLGARGPERLDGGVPVAVASWRDGKFDFAITGILKGGRCTTSKVDATALKRWIKGTE